MYLGLTIVICDIKLIFFVYKKTRMVFSRMVHLDDTISHRHAFVILKLKLKFVQL